MNNKPIAPTYSHSLSGLRICLAGTFRMPTLEMNKRLRQLGVVQIDRVTTISSNNAVTTPPVKETTNLFVLGENAPEDSIKRYELNCHDGFKALQITEHQLYALMNGELEMDIPRTVTKHIDLDYSYYEWMPPSINGHILCTRLSSPMRYDMTNILSPVARKEIYLPDIEGTNMRALRQIIGNLGGYANPYYDANTEIVLLSNQTIEKWRNGVKDQVILDLERQYNEGDTKTFNIQFSCESDFIRWVVFRLEKSPEYSTIELVKQLQ